MPRQRPTRIRKAVEQAGEEPQAETATAVAGTATVANLAAGDSEGSDPTSKNELTENQQQMADTIAAMSGRYAASDVGGGIASELLPTIGGTVDSVIPGRATPSLDVFQANAREAIEESNQPLGPETPSLLDVSGGRLPAPDGFTGASTADDLLRPGSLAGGENGVSGFGTPTVADGGIPYFGPTQSQVIRALKWLSDSPAQTTRQAALDGAKAAAEAKAKAAAEVKAKADAEAKAKADALADEESEDDDAGSPDGGSDGGASDGGSDESATDGDAAGVPDVGNPGPDGEGATIEQKIAFREYFIGIAGGYDGRGGQRGGEIDPDENATIEKGTPTGSLDDAGRGLKGDGYDRVTGGSLGPTGTPDGNLGPGGNIVGNYDPNDDELQMGEPGQHLDVQTDREEDLSRLFNDDDDTATSTGGRWSGSTATKLTIPGSDDHNRNDDIDD